jgi:hypothetical protein
MEWSKEVPKVDGWYWVVGRGSGTKIAHVYFCPLAAKLCIHFAWEWEPDDMSCCGGLLYCGPIEVPTPPEVK